jgi:hypothetical protein
METQGFGPDLPGKMDLLVRLGRVDVEEQVWAKIMHSFLNLCLKCGFPSEISGRQCDI